MTETKEKYYKLSDLILDACDEFDNIMCDSDSDEDDVIHEIADTSVPIYYWDIAQYVAWNPLLMQEIPETGRECEPYKMIQMNIYEAICEGLYEHIAKKEEEDGTDTN